MRTGRSAGKSDERAHMNAKTYLDTRVSLNLTDTSVSNQAHGFNKSTERGNYFSFQRSPRAATSSAHHRVQIGKGPTAYSSVGTGRRAIEPYEDSLHFRQDSLGGPQY